MILSGIRASTAMSSKIFVHNPVVCSNHTFMWCEVILQLGYNQPFQNGMYTEDGNGHIVIDHSAKIVCAIRL